LEFPIAAFAATHNSRDNPMPTIRAYDSNVFGHLTKADVNSSAS